MSSPADRYSLAVPVSAAASRFSATAVPAVAPVAGSRARATPDAAVLVRRFMTGSFRDFRR
ncbi:hypothetical protein AMK31_19395 [Streptomyces sp. TSRI0107]|nr:hypothetical protein AMK31_19395 [Streptomyces sp. TSRI0107]